MNIYPGMVLRVWSVRKSVYHYGIASYDGYVIDHAPREGTAMRTWQEFSEGEEVEIVERQEGDFPPDIIHDRAYDNIGANEYSVFGLNCEHFVSWCMRNKAESLQIKEKVVKVAVYSALAFAGYKLLRYLLDDDESEGSEA